MAKIVRFFGYVKYINAYQKTRKQAVKAGKGSEFDIMYLKELITLLRDYAPPLMWRKDRDVLLEELKRYDPQALAS